METLEAVEDAFPEHDVVNSSTYKCGKAGKQGKKKGNHTIQI